MQLSIIIPVYISDIRSASRLKLTIEGFSLQSVHKNKFEVILVDDGSTLVVEQIIDEKIKQLIDIKVIRQEHKGMCSAINHGASFAKGEYILLGIDDNVPLSNTIEMFLNRVNFEDDKKVYMGQEWWLWHSYGMKDLITGELFDELDKEQFIKQYSLSFRRFPKITSYHIHEQMSKLINLAKVPKDYQYIEDVLNNKREGNEELLWICTRIGALFMKKDTFFKIGKMDEQLDPYGWYADLELGYRLLEQGYQLHMLPEVKFLHLPHYKSKETMDAEFESFQYFLNKYKSLDIALLPFYWTSSRDIEQFFDQIKRVKINLQLV
ncbi:hypothetical protein COJ27_29860 [Bacillus cereus]|uniref:glycosyltransferase family 2 protein n=1 Tax=Bacillus cereus TaxID=1396 RepID=UPI000BF46DA4|nr:glycosyltransferase family 2 protein [Bacillus cereus]PFL57209.1 hypothetical protein COJ27_29860 [Bacillus cereus]